MSQFPFRTIGMMIYLNILQGVIFAGILIASLNTHWGTAPILLAALPCLSFVLWGTQRADAEAAIFTAPGGISIGAGLAWAVYKADFSFGWWAAVSVTLLAVPVLIAYWRHDHF